MRSLAACAVSVSLLVSSCKSTDSTTGVRGSIRGSVVLTGATDASGVVVTAAGPGSASAITDAFGAYSLDGLAGGTYVITFAAPSTIEGAQVRQAKLPALGIANLEPVTFQPAGSIAGTVTLADPAQDPISADAGPGPSMSALVAIEGTDHVAYVSGAGAFRLDGVPAGSRTLLVTNPGYDTRRVQVLVPYGGVIKVDVGLSPTQGPPPAPTPTGAIAGIAALDGLDDSSGIVVTLTGPVSRALITDATGSIQFSELPAGQYLITAAAPWTAERVLAQPAVVQDAPADKGGGGVEPSAVAFTFTPLGALAGQVALGNGAPAAGAIVTAPLNGARTVVGGDGTFRIDVPIGDQQLIVALDGFVATAFDTATAVYAQTTPLSPSPLVLLTPPPPPPPAGKIAGYALPLSLAPGTLPVNVAACVSDGTQTTGDCTPISADAVGAADGSFTVNALPDGFYQLSLSAGPYHERIPWVLTLSGSTGLLFANNQLAPLNSTLFELPYGDRVLSASDVGFGAASVDRSTQIVYSAVPGVAFTCNGATDYLASNVGEIILLAPTRVAAGTPCNGAIQLAVGDASGVGLLPLGPVNSPAVLAWGRGIFTPGEQALLWASALDYTTHLTQLSVRTPAGDVVPLPEAIQVNASAIAAPAFTADGTRFAYATGPTPTPPPLWGPPPPPVPINGTTDLVLADITGNSQALAHDALADATGELRFADEERHVIYRTMTGDLASALVSAPGTTATLGSNVWRYELSSDTTVVALYKDYDQWARTGTLETVKVGGTARTPIATSVSDFRVVRTPDGDFLVYAAMDPLTWTWQLFLTSFETGLIASVPLGTSQSQISFTVAADGSAVGYALLDQDWVSSAWVASISTQPAPHQVSAAPLIDSSSPQMPLVFAAGNGFGFIEQGASGQGGVLKVATAAADPITIEPDSAQINAVSPDGRWLIYSAFDTVNYGPPTMRAAAVDGSSTTDLAVGTLMRSVIFSSRSNTAWFQVWDADYSPQVYFAGLGSGLPAAALGPAAIRYTLLPSGRIVYAYGTDPWSPPSELKLAGYGDAGFTDEHLAPFNAGSPVALQARELGDTLLYYDETMTLQARSPTATTALAPLASFMDVSPDGKRLLLQRSSGFATNARDLSFYWTGPTTVLSIGLDGAGAVDLLRAPTASQWLSTPLGPAALSLRGVGGSLAVRGGGTKFAFGPTPISTTTTTTTATTLPSAGTFGFQQGLYVAIDPRPVTAAVAAAR